MHLFPVNFLLPYLLSIILLQQSENGLHRSNSEKLVNSVEIIEVADVTAVCDGGGGVLGHPIEYIQLNTVSNEPAICKYCGLRFRRKVDFH